MSEQRPDHMVYGEPHAEPLISCSDAFCAEKRDRERAERERAAVLRAAEARVVEAADRYIGGYNTARVEVTRANLQELAEAVSFLRAFVSAPGDGGMGGD